jgi:hypothetical protein
VKNEVISDARSSQALFFLQLLAGKLNEAWKLFSEKYVGKPSLTGIEPGFSEDGRKALKDIIAYFQPGGGTIYVMRNKFAFHYDEGLMTRSLQELDPGEPVQLWITEQVATTRNDMGTRLVFRMLRTKFDDKSRCTSPSGAQRAAGALAQGVGEEADVPGKAYGVQRFLEEVTRMTRSFIRFTDQIVLCLIGDTLQKTSSVIDVSRSDDPGLPAFPDAAELVIGDSKRTPG